MTKVITNRASGVLIHITSLPSPFGIGDLGKGAYKFCDLLSKSRQNYWQILPLNPTDSAMGNSPYSSNSAFAGNPLLISPEGMVEDGILCRKDINNNGKLSFNFKKVDFSKVINYKRKLFKKAFANFRNISEKGKVTEEYKKFCYQNKYWLDDYSLFMSIKNKFNQNSWSQWPKEIRDRKPDLLDYLKENLRESIEFEKFIQYIFFNQWHKFRNYCNSRGIKIIGDMPIYVSYDSSDVWSNPEIFKLDSNRNPQYVSGVPPDYFSSTGQLWGNPVYNWNFLKNNNFNWWIKRMEHNFNLFDLVRVDHFRGLISYWEIPAGEKTAINGKWIKVPWEDFFNDLIGRFEKLPIIAEDLGVITEDVREVIKRFGLPGMKVLLFAFGEDNPDHPYLPHNYKENYLVYSGTHDNNTIKGWFEYEANENDKNRFYRYIGKRVNLTNVNWEFIRLAMMSVAILCIFPIQDILGLGKEARMNNPSTLNEENWVWRLAPEMLKSKKWKKLADMSRIYGRG